MPLGALAARVDLAGLLLVLIFAVVSRVIAIL